MIIRSDGSCSVSPGTTSLILENCRKATVIEEPFQNAPDLNHLEFVNVSEVSIQGRLFPSNGPPRTVQFINSTIPDVPSFSFSGNIKAVVFENSYVGIIRPFAFSNIISADSIIFRDTNVTHVEAQSFKKFTVDKFILFGSQFNVIPSRFVVDLIVNTVFKIDFCYIEVIRTLGFKISGPKKLVVVDSKVNKLSGESFRIETKGEVIIEDNVFNTVTNEAFRGLSVDKYVIQQTGRQKLRFRNQTITNLEEKSLFFNRTVFDVLIERLQVDEACTCDEILQWKNIITIGTKAADTLDSELELIWCHMDDTKEGDTEYISARDFYKDHCKEISSGIYFFVIIITGTGIIMACLVMCIVCMLRKRRKWKPVPCTARENQRKTKVDKKGRRKEDVNGKQGSTKAMIVPDGRTYTETEFHIIVEKAEPLKDECIPYTVVRDKSRNQIN